MPFLVATTENNHAAVILVGQEFNTLDVLEWVDVLIFLVEED